MILNGEDQRRAEWEVLQERRAEIQETNACLAALLAAVRSSAGKLNHLMEIEERRN